MMDSLRSPQVERIAFTKAQQRRLQELNRQLQIAQREMQGYIDYLVDEYEITASEGWGVTPNLAGFEKMTADNRLLTAGQNSGVSSQQSAANNGKVDEGIEELMQE